MAQQHRLTWWYVLTFGALPALAVLDVAVIALVGGLLLPELFGALAMVGVALLILLRVRPRGDREPPSEGAG
ncbi:hypothetical protein [Kitasatospora sp. NPDC057223]|uniref:hypothetical protein n=1 Tax=Kitasatospora sp. NPDC057223 TaxID=3346055 RepID=UPI003635B930